MNKDTPKLSNAIEIDNAVIKDHLGKLVLDLQLKFEKTSKRR